MTFYRTKSCPGCQAIEDTLNDLAIAFNCVALKDESQLPPELSSRKLPLLLDEDQVICGSHAIIEHLEKLADFKKQWYKYQSDACYCDEE